MKPLLKILAVLIMGGVALAVAGCAETQQTADDGMTPHEHPSKDDDSHGWGASIGH